MSRILHIPEWYPSLQKKQHGGFVYQWVKTIAKYTPQASHRVLYFEKRGNRSFSTRSCTTFDEVIYYKNLNASKIKDTWDNIRFGFKLRQEVKQADLIHVHIIGKSGLLAMRWAKQRGIPYVVQDHFSGWVNYTPDEMQKHFPFLEEYLSLMKTAHAIFVTSQLLKNALLQYVDCEIEIVGNIIPDLYRPAVLAKRSTFTFAMIADFREHIKQIIPVIEAFKQHAQHYSSHRLVLIGDGDDREAILSAMDMHPRIQWLGEQTQQEVHRLLPEYHVVIGNSRLETFGMTILEALSAGVPVILRKNKATDLLLDDSAGILLESNAGISEITKAMGKMSQKHHAFTSFHLRSFAHPYFPQSATKPILHAYQAILQAL